MKRSYITILVTLLVIMVALAGCGGSAPPPKEPAQGSPDDGDQVSEDLELVIYGSCGEPHIAAVAAGFEEATGIKTTFTRLSTGEVLTRIKEEKGNPRADVWFGGTTDPYNEAINLGLLASFVPENAKNLRSDVYKDPDGYWHGIYSGYLGFICNEALLNEKDLPIPQDWEDLIDPQYENCISFADPGASGTGKQLLNTLGQMWGDDKAMDYFAKLDKNVRQYPKTGQGPSQLVGAGELEIAIGFLHDGVTQIVMGYDDVVLVAPESGTSFEVGATAIIEGCKNREAAEIFINWALTPECQELGQEAGYYQFLTVNDAKDPEIATEMLSDVKLIDYDFDEAAKNAADRVERWNQVITQDKLGS